MFFGPSKDNIKAAEILDFYTKNILGDMLIDLSKREPEIFKSISSSGKLNLSTWTKSAQITAVTYIYTSLSNSNIRGKQKLMEIMANTINNKSSFTLAEMMDSYSFFNQQMLSLISKNGPEERTEKQTLMILGEMTLSQINQTKRRTIDEIMNDGLLIKEIFIIGRYTISPFMAYFK
jgi:Fe-S cluster biosynthesis and repair protein YggX